MPLLPALFFRRGYGQWITSLTAVVLVAMPWNTRTWLLWPLSVRVILDKRDAEARCRAKKAGISFLSRAFSY